MVDIPALAETPAAAFRVAAREIPPNSVLTTGRLLAVLSRLDVAGDWQRIWLHTGEPVALGLAEAPDDIDDVSVHSLEGVPLSAQLAHSLGLLSRIASAYRLEPAPSGALAVALLADPASGAARVLLRSGSLSHDELLAMVQSALLRTRLNRLDQLIAKNGVAADAVAVSAGSAAPIAQTATAAPVVSAGAPLDLDEMAVPRRRLRLLGWRALSCVALGLTLLAVFWHRAFLPPPTAIEVPPYPAPAVAAKMLTTAELPNAGGGGWLQLQDGPPDGGIFVGTGRLFADLRHELVAGAWQRTWETADSGSLVQIRAIEVRRREYATSFLNYCQPQVSRSVPLADRSGYTQKSPSGTTACAQALRGRTVIGIVVESSDQDAEQLTWRVLARLAARQLPALPAAAPDLSTVSALDSPTRIALLDAYMWVVLGIPLLLGLANLLRDRSAWRRIRSRLARTPRSGAFSVAPLVESRLARYSALTLTRVAVIAWTLRLTELPGFGTWQTLGTVAVAIVGILAVEWIIRRRRPPSWRPPIFRGRRWLLAASSLVLSAAVAGAGVVVVVAGIDLSGLQVNPGGASYVSAQLGLRIVVAGVFLALAALLPFTFARRLGMRALRQQAKDPARDGIPPVLMLRSFADDMRLLRARRLDRASIVERLCLRRYERFEEVAASALAVHGPVYALSRVGEKLPPALGAERRSFDMADWKDRVRELIRSARLISVTVGRSESLLWEIGEIKAAGALAKTIFLLPPTSQRDERRRLVVLARALNLDFSQFDQVGAGRDVLAVAFPDGVKPAVITGRAPDDAGYENAIAVWSQTVTGSADGYPGDVRLAAAGYAGYVMAGGQATALRMHGRPAPKYKIYPPGKAPVYRPAWRRLLRWRTLGWSGLIWGPILGVVSTAILGSSSAAQTITARYSVGLLVQDQASSAVYGVFGRHLIQRIDFSNPTQYTGTYVKDPVSGLEVDGDVGYYVSGATGDVGRVDLETGRLAWVRAVAVGVRSPVLVDGRLTVVSPATGRIVELAAVGGRVVASRNLPETPYQTVVAAGRLYVSLMRSNQVAELDPGTLATIATDNVPRGPWSIVAQGDRVWVVSTLGHVITALGQRPPSTARLWLSVQLPDVSANPGWLGIQGMEWVTLISPTGQLTRIPLPNPAIQSLLVEGDGTVIVGYQTGEIDQLG